MPGAGNPQALNRYSYALNDPVGLTDPSGHGPPGQILMDQEGAERYFTPSTPSLVKFGGDWDEQRKEAVLAGAHQVAYALAGVVTADQRAAQAQAAATGMRMDPAEFSQLSGLWGSTPGEVFHAVYGGTPTFQRESHTCAEANSGASCWAKYTGGSTITVYADAFSSSSYAGLGGSINTAHELGHFFAGQANSQQPYTDYGNWAEAPQGRTGLVTGWQGNPKSLKNSELFVDTFLGWSYHHLAANDAGNARQDWMDTNMPGWMALAVK